MLSLLFQSTLPVWGATRISENSSSKVLSFQSTLPVWGATANSSTKPLKPLISIHAPRVGSDTASCRFKESSRYFNPRSPCGERRFYSGPDAPDPAFQSTLPVWGATRSLMSGFVRIKHFNPRSPCGERPRDFTLLMKRIHFNPRSPCGERPVTAAGIHAAAQFQSTLPVWGATPEVELGSGLILYFNPRSPCGERQQLALSLSLLPLFQSTLPVWGATDLPGHSGHREGFQSTLPVWGATYMSCKFSLSSRISIHAPRVGSDDI